MSLSEPCSPSKEASSSTVEDEKWFATSSCADLGKDDAENSKRDVLYAARLSSLSRKRSTILKFLEDNEDKLDEGVKSLRCFARGTGGLIDDEIRKVVWPVLARNLPLSSHAFESDEPELEELSAEEANTHKDWNQVQLDVHRTVARFPPNIDDDDRADLKTQLTPLIIKIISARRTFQYYQGFHDVFLTLLLVVGQESAEEIGRLLVQKGVFHDYLSLRLDEGVCKQLELINVLLSKVDPTIEAIFTEIVQVFDACLSTDPLFPIYLCAMFIMYRKPEILATEREMPYLHKLLGTMPKDLRLDSIISDALFLAKLVPPGDLQGKHLREYQEKGPKIPNIRPVVKSISRYAIQIFVMGAASAAAGYFLLSKQGL